MVPCYFSFLITCESWIDSLSTYCQLSQYWSSISIIFVFILVIAPSSTEEMSDGHNLCFTSYFPLIISFKVLLILSFQRTSLSLLIFSLFTYLLISALIFISFVLFGFNFLFLWHSELETRITGFKPFSSNLCLKAKAFPLISTLAAPHTFKNIVFSLLFSQNTF